jgi:hypothetical protein
VPDKFLGLAGDDPRTAFRMFHVWKFRDGLMSRENVRLDGRADRRPTRASRPHSRPRITVTSAPFEWIGQRCPLDARPESTIKRVAV